MAAKPIKLTNPVLLLGTEDLTCFARGIHLLGEEDSSLATFCDPIGYSWKLSVDFLMSLGLDSLDEALTTLGGPGTVVTFEFAYTTAVASADNPHWTGSVRLGTWPIVDAGIDEPTEFEMEMTVIGEVVKDVI